MRNWNMIVPSLYADSVTCFDRTYEELKPAGWAEAASGSASFDRTYEELKLRVA